jgi:ATP-dependent helicase/nuclease subunit A
MTKQLPDQKARQDIRTLLKHTLLVEAGAGSGKTTSLVGRMTALIAKGFCSMETLAAVTFTRKAAGELRERFQEELEHAYADEINPTQKSRIATALTRLDRAFIGTIHSFCSRILRERPVEAGLSPDFIEIEGLEEKLLAESAWEEYLLTARFTHTDRLKTIHALDVTPHDLKEAYQNLLLYPDVELNAPPVPYPDFTYPREELAKLLLLAKTNLPTSPPPGNWDKLQLLLRQALRWQRIFDLDNDRYLLRLLSAMDKNRKPTLNRWGTKEEAKETEAAFNHFREHFLQPTLQAWREYRYPLLLDFLLPAVRHCEETRRQENKLNFQDLLMRTATLLKNNSEVRTYFRERFTHLLVDEFQDTDPIQAQIMMYLTGIDTTETDWTKLIIHPGSLFVVGDPKQSIYRFRRADIDIYNHVKAQIKASGGQIIHLTTNFRSLPDIIDWVNPAFNNLLSRSSAPYQAEPVPMDTVRTPNPNDTGGLFVIPLEQEPRHKQEHIARQDAQSIASWIRACLDGHITITQNKESATPATEDFMILVRYKNNMAHYARALEQYNIRFTLSGGSDIQSSKELHELHIILQAIADPDNPVALVAALRGLYFGISDQDLYRLKKANGRFNFLINLPQDSHIQNQFAIPWEKLCLYHTWSRTLPPSTFLEKITADLGLIPYTLSGSMGKGRTGYVLQLIELIRRREENNQTAFADTVDFIGELLQTGAEEEVDIEGGKSLGVRIMNLHKAKGLEAPIVILANPGKTTSHAPTLHVSRTSGTPQGYLQIVKRGMFTSEILAQPQSWASHKEEETLYQDSEEMRLIYVAATRAKNILTISTYPPKPELSPWQPLDYFLEDTTELEIPDVPIPEKLVPTTSITPQLLQNIDQQINQDIARVMVPTYNRTTVTDLTKSQDAPERQYTGKGMTWGNVIHNALDAIIRTNETANLNILIPQLLTQEKRSENEKEEVRALLQNVLQSPFWQRVRQASEKHSEVPFGIYEGNNYLTGTIDLAFLEEGGWVLIDYKTDTVRDVDHLQELMLYYEPQVKEYAQRWEEMTGERVKQKGLLFIDGLKVQFI